MSHFDSLKCFRYRSDLVELDKDAVCAAKLNTLLESFCVGNKEVVTNELYFAAKSCGKLLPAFPVFFVKCVFYRDNRVLVAKACPVVDEFIRCKVFA